MSSPSPLIAISLGGGKRREEKGEENVEDNNSGRDKGEREREREKRFSWLRKSEKNKAKWHS